MVEGNRDFLEGEAEPRSQECGNKKGADAVAMTPSSPDMTPAAVRRVSD